MAQTDNDDRFIGVGEKIVDEQPVDPNQTAIPAADDAPEPMPGDLVDYLDTHFEKTSGPHGGQWRGPFIWVEFGAGQVTIWNAKNMRYVHHKFGSATPGWIKAAIEWIAANKDVEQEIPAHVRESGEALAKMWEQSGRNPENESK